jgi:DNA-binding transcriptional MerR regulator
MPLTVSEIAERTGHGGDNRFIERLHYWTRERLLLPTGKRNPGTGRRRRYPDTAWQDAVILNAMMEGGVSVEDQHRAMKIVREHIERGTRKDLWPQGTPNLFLAIEKLPGLPGRPYFHEGQYTMDGRFERVNVFNLTTIFSVLRNEGAANV